MTLPNLIAELERAMEGSESLDKTVARYLGFRIAATTGGPHIMRQNDDMASWDLPKHSRSLDAKLPWENIRAINHDHASGSWTAAHMAEERVFWGIGKTEALARRIAALKAREEGG